MTKKKTVNTVLLVIYLTIFSKAFGLLRDIMIGFRYGTSMESDAYFAAYRMSITIFLSIGSAITATTIPFIVKFIKLDERLHLQSFLNKLITAMVASGGVIAGAGILFAPFYTRIIAVGFEGEKLQLAVRMVRIFFPVIILVPLVYLMISILQANERFAVTSMISIPHNVILITYLIVFNQLFGIMGLAYATLLGWVGQFLLLYLFAREDKPIFRLDLQIDDELKSFFKLMVPILMSSAVYNINILVDSSIASTLADGQLSSLNFANIAYTAVATTSIYGISTVLFPQFSALAAEDDLASLRLKISQSVQVMIFIFMPVIFGMIAINKELIQVLYQRGTFGIDSVAYTSSTLVFYAVGMLGFAFQELSNKVFYALKDTRTPFVTSAISVALNIILNLIFVRFWGIRGLALATSIAVTFNGLILMALIQKRIGKLEIKDIGMHFSKILMISMIMLVGVYGFNQLPINLYLRMALAVLLGVAIYYIMSDRMNISEIQYIKNEIQSLREVEKEPENE